MRKTFILAILVLASILVLSRHLQADDPTPVTPPYDWRPLDGIIGSTGALREDVDTFTLPRTDLNVSVDSMEVPAAAGIASEFHFFHCSCGKMRVIGQFCCADYESNDVIDAIRVGAIMQVANVGPMFVSDKPRIMIVRFQGEGDAFTLAKLIKSGLSWMGDERMKPTAATQPVK
jgi:hypothetical protein